MAEVQLLQAQPLALLLPLLLLLLLLAAADGSIGSWQPKCSFGRSDANVGEWILDCSNNSSSSSSSSSRTFVAIAASGGRVTWRLSPSLQGEECINRLAPFDSSHPEWPGEASLLLLQRLRQRRFSLRALRPSASLRHLAIEAANFTCLRRGDFAPVAGLRTLSLIDNRRLRCLRPGALAELSDLRSLVLTGSVSLLSLHPAAMPQALRQLRLGANPELRLREANLCRLRHLQQLQLDFRVGSRQLLGLQRLRTLLLPGRSLLNLLKLRNFVCYRDEGLSLSINGDSAQRLVTEEVAATASAFCNGVDADSVRQLSLAACSRGSDAGADCGCEEADDANSSSSSSSSTSSSTSTSTSSASLAAAAAAADAS